MTTSINGYVIPKDLTISEIRRLLRPFQEEVRNQGTWLLTDYLAKTCTDVIDHRAVGIPVTIAIDTPVPEDEAPLPFVWGSASRRYATVYDKGTRDLDVDIECEVLVATAAGKTFFRLLTEKEFYGELFVRATGAAPLPWWDGAPDEDISETEWKIREKLWDEALGAGAQCLNSFSIKCFGQYGFPNILSMNVVKLVPPLEIRVVTLAKEIVLQDRIQAVLAGKDEAQKLNQIFGTVREAEAEIAAHPELLRAEEERIRALLQPVITTADLVGEVAGVREG